MYLDDVDYRAPRGFNALFSLQTYKNILYMFLSLPLGIMYFVLFTIGFSVGFGLLVVLIGLPILMMTMMGSNALASFERELNRLLLGVDIEKPSEDDYGHDWRGKLRGFVSPQSIMGLIYLFLKFPFGLFAFVVTVILSSATFGMIFAPFALIFSDTRSTEVLFFDISSLLLAFVFMGLGLLLAPISLTVINRIAEVWGMVAERLLSPAQETRYPMPAKNDANRLQGDSLSVPARSDYFYRDSEILAREDTPPKMKNRFLKEE